MINYILTFVLGLVTGITGNYIYDKIKIKFLPDKKLYLQNILQNFNDWEKSAEDLYVYKKEPNYFIKIFERRITLSDRFKKFPDKEHDSINWVEVKYNNLFIFGWNFMNLDGCRYFVPIPKTEFDPRGEQYDYYDMNSIEIKLFQIIGEANLKGEESKIEGLKNISKILNIKITNI